MATPSKDRRPGDLILDRILPPNASAEERELGHQHLRLLAKVVLRIAKRRAAEKGGADSRPSADGGMMES